MADKSVDKKAMAGKEAGAPKERVSPLKSG
jgi:hypothetical protein